MKEYLIGVDVSTTGTKTGIFDRKGNAIVKIFQESRLYYPKPGYVEQNLEEIYNSVINTIKKAVKESNVNPQKIAGIGLDGQMAGICAIDKNWNPVTHYDSWLDVRCKEYVNLMEKKCGNLILKKTGAPPMVAGGAKILWWKEKKPEIFEKIDKFIQPTVYVAGKMANLKGEDAFIDYTYLHFMGFSDNCSISWSKELCDIFQMPIKKLPRIVEPWKIIGKLSQGCARECGLIEGIPIVAGSGDQAAGPLGAGIVEPGLIFDVAGTASVFSTCVDKYTPDREHKTLIFQRSVIPALWYPLSYISGGGLCLRWFRDNFSESEKLTAQEKNMDAYDFLNKIAREVPAGSEGLIFLPHLGGRSCPNEPDVRGLWQGFSWKHKKGHFYRSIMESIAYEYLHYLEIQKKLFPHIKFKEVRVIGGGSRSNLWNQIKADVLGLPYAKIDRDECAILGSAILAGYGVGIFDDLATTSKQFVKTTERWTPRIEYERYYREFARIYINILEKNKEIFEELSRLSPFHAIIEKD